MINFSEYDFDTSPVVMQDKTGHILINLTVVLPVAGGLMGYHEFGIMGLAAGAVISFGAMYFATINIKAWIERARLECYGSRLENIYEVSHWPKDNQVYQRAQMHREWLEKSGNQNNVMVHELIFREGEFVNETIEQYQERVQLFIQDDRARRHRFFRDADRVLYLKHMKDQAI